MDRLEASKMLQTNLKTDVSYSGPHVNLNPDSFKERGRGEFVNEFALRLLMSLIVITIKLINNCNGLNEKHYLFDT